MGPVTDKDCFFLSLYRTIKGYYFYFGRRFCTLPLANIIQLWINGSSFILLLSTRCYDSARRARLFLVYKRISEPFPYSIVSLKISWKGENMKNYRPIDRSSSMLTALISTGSTGPGPCSSSCLPLISSPSLKFSCFCFRSRPPFLRSTLLAIVACNFL